MTKLISSAKDAFTNPDSPMYYVVGVIFLVLMVAAVVIYIVLTKKHSAKSRGENADFDKMGEIENTSSPETATENADEKVEAEKSAEPQTEREKAESTERPDESAQPEPDDNAQQKQVEEEIPEQVNEQEEAGGEAEPEPEQVKAETSEQPAAEVKANPEKSAPKTARPKPAAKKTAKPFIDRLIADPSVHGVYNEIKNTLLSYPGIKAKLDKDGENFTFGTDAKAKITLDGGSIYLYLGVPKENVPSQFKVENAEGALPTVLHVKETEIDDAQRLIKFSMNVSMLTFNDRHRHVDYVKKAIDAKQRAKKK